MRLNHRVNKIKVFPNLGDARHDVSANGTDVKEIFVNQFAANLLMPEEAVKMLSHEKKQHFEMALYFGVSAESLKYRLRSLGLLA